MREMKSYFGSVTIRALDSLTETATALNVIFDGGLEEDQTGRFEDYPAFVYTNGPMEIQLIGSNEGDTGGDSYSLTVKCVKIDSDDFGSLINSKFMTALPTNLPVEKNGYANISQYLSQYVSTNTTLDCSVAWVS